MENPIIIAMDGFSKPGDIDRMVDIARKLRPYVWGFKINDAFIRYGWSAVNHLCVGGSKIMLDMKFYDIPNTVKNHCEVIKEAESDAIPIVTVHAHGGAAMMKAASDVLPGRVAAVTVLTSFDEETYSKSLCLPEISLERMVLNLALTAQDSGCSHVVCSGGELRTLRPLRIKKIVPGIRPAWHAKADDQKRTMTPRQAMDAGATYLVIGRPILEAASPEDAAKRTLDEIMDGKS